MIVAATHPIPPIPPTYPTPPIPPHPPSDQLSGALEAAATDIENEDPVHQESCRLFHGPHFMFGFFPLHKSSGQADEHCKGGVESARLSGRVRLR
jgi:hypothetical protein